MSSDYGGYWPRYVRVAEHRRRAAKKAASMKKAGRDVSPVEIAGRKIATTFWGQAWCRNLEAYSDYSNRLPRGRSYVRNGSVLDLRIEAGRVRTLVSGTRMYTVDIAIKSLAKKRWTEIKSRCAGQIDSLIELLQGSLSKNVMEIVTRHGEGLFPSPREISLDCSCPDWATMCKHVAASLYGVGARLDREPELLFTLRGVDPTEMVEAAVDQPAGHGTARKGRLLETDELSSVFGVDIDMNDTDMKGVTAGDASAMGKPAGNSGRRAKTARTAKTRRSAGSVAKKKAAAGTATGKGKAAKSSAGRSRTKKNGAAKNVAARKTAAKKVAAKKTVTKKVPAKKAPHRARRSTISSRKKARALVARPKKATTKKTKSTKRVASKTTSKKKTVAKRRTRKAKR